MTSLALLVPGSIETLTGGYGYDRRIVAGLRTRGWTVSVEELDASFPQPTPDALDHAARTLSALPDGTTVLVDGLAFGAMPDEATREAARLRLVALVHLPLAMETGLDPHVARALEASERRSLAAARHVIVTSRATAADAGAYGVPRDRISVVEPGTDPAPMSRGSGSARTHFLCVAALVPRKGHEILFRALASIAGRHDWFLTCVGSADRNREAADRLCARLRAEGLDDRVRLAGEADPEAVATHYDGADVFVLPTLYETYGMAVAEALARGLPVISTPTGAIADLVGDDAGLLVPAGDADALAAAISRVLDDEELRQRLRAGAARARAQLPTWEDATELMANVLERVTISWGPP